MTEIFKDYRRQVYNRSRVATCVQAIVIIGRYHEVEKQSMKTNLNFQGYVSKRIKTWPFRSFKLANNQNFSKRGSIFTF